MKTIKSRISEILKHFPVVNSTYQYLKEKKRIIFNPFLKYSPPGQYNSSLPDYSEILRNKDHILRKESAFSPDINLNESQQLTLIEKFSVYSNEIPFSENKKPGQRYYYDNMYFRHSDAAALYSILRYFNPQRVIEIGSGFSSSLMLDTNDLIFEGSISFTFIEPFPKRLYNLLTENDHKQCKILENFIQEVDLKIFKSLEKDDLLFIDSSHVLKVGSDLSHILFSILPQLNPGVIIHFHDIFWPFEYPLKWFNQGRSYNEIYALRTFLQYNNTFEVIFFPSYLYEFHREILSEKIPLSSKEKGGGSIYLRKMR